MKVRTKLALLLGFWVFLLAGILIFYANVDRSRILLLSQEETRERNLLFDEILKLKENLLETFASDYTFWDEMVNFVAQKDPNWAKENIDVELGTYKTDLVFVYDQDFNPVYFTSVPGLETCRQMAFNRTELSALASGQKRLFHFFSFTPSGKLTEFYGATIHPTNDPTRKTVPKGYFFVGRLWTDHYVKELANLTHSRIMLSGMNSGNPFAQNEYGEASAAYFSRVFKDWQDKPVMRLDGIFDLRMIEEFSRLSERSILGVLILCFIGMLAYVLLFNRWINGPVTGIYRALDQKDKSYLALLERSRDDFGAIARSLIKYFRQGEELASEIEVRKRTENTLREYASILNATLESTADAILVVDKEGKIVSRNLKFLKLWNVPESLSLEKDDSILINYVSSQVFNQEEFLRKIKLLYAQPDLSAYDIFRLKDGRIFERHSIPHRLGEDVVGRVWTFRDITERKLDEENIRRLKVAFEQSIDGILITDLAGFTKFVNRSWALMHGYKVSELAGKHFSFFFSPEQMEEEIIPFNLQVKADGWNEAEVAHLHRNGLAFQTWMTASLLKNEDGIPTGLVISIRDITERRKAELQLEAAYNELKNTQAQLVQSAKMAAVGELGSGVAHEINNPLTGVLNNVQLIKMMVRDNQDCKIDDLKELFDIIEESANRCIRITRSLLDFSHASKGVLEPLDINATVVKVVDLVGHDFELDNIKMEQSLAPGLPMIKGDEQLLEQAVFNIISNSRWAIRKKHSSQPGSISLKTELADGGKSVVLYIRDTGVGIAPENRRKIFEPFFTTKDKGEGTGLGMAIVSNIISRHGAKIEVESEVGVGTGFKLIFPVR